MKLLLVDDEEHARDGLVSMIDWDKLGIGELITAKNGVEGLKKAGDFEPDIVVTDVRMPKMDGIQMAFRIRELYPECSILFMSGYSDKEYLKAAISVSAVSYVEKPIDLDEMKRELKSACRIQMEKRAALEKINQMDDKIAAGLEALKNQAAIGLTRKTPHFEELLQKIGIAYPGISRQSGYRTFLIQLAGRRGEEAGGGEMIPLSRLAGYLEEGLKDRGLEGITGYKDERYLVVHVCTGEKRNREVAANPKLLLKWFAQMLEPDYRYYLAAGSEVIGLEKVYESYHEAVVLLQQSFFFPPDRIFTEKIGEEAGKEVFRLGDHELKIFQEKLLYDDFEKTVEFIQNAAAEIRQKPDTLVFYVKEFFYRCMVCLAEAAGRRELLAFEAMTETMIHDQVWEACSLSELESLLIDNLQLYFENVSEENGKQAVSERVKYYVSRHYGEMDLSLATIAEKLKLTSSYLCIVFKKECKITLTQYIMEYRVARAKEYLADETMKIKDIAFLTGYQNSNYFIKVFKKIEGVTPLEYRSAK